MSAEFPQVPGYRLLRKIGSGGFGTVYLAQKVGAFDYVALKFIQTSQARRERQALEKYVRFPDKRNWVQITDWGDAGDAVFYVMPLADVLPGRELFAPEDFRWQEASLQKLIDRRLASPHEPWFSREEILGFIEPIFDAAIALGEGGLLHRDIKPANILFFGGKAKLADFGLLDDDRRSLSRIGTPLYSAPSWFAGSGGNPDAYGLATTLYSLMTGNLPDTIGRAAYRFPEKWREDVAPELREQWLHWHRCILRSIAENPADRFVTLEDFKRAVLSGDFRAPMPETGAKETAGPSPKRFRFPGKKVLAGLGGLAVVVAGVWAGANWAAEKPTPEGRIEVVRPSKVNLEPGTRSRFSGAGKVDEVHVSGKGRRDLQVEAPFVVELLKLYSDGELNLAGGFSGKTRVEMVLSGDEHLRFTGNPDGTPNAYALKSIRVNGLRDTFAEPDIIVEKGAVVRIEESLHYSFHCDLQVNGVLELSKIEGWHFIDIWGNGVVRAGAVRCGHEGFYVQDGVRFEVGRGGLIGDRCDIGFAEATLAVTESWEAPATGISLINGKTVTFDVQTADGSPTAAEVRGVVGGNGALLKRGSGMLTLSGKNTYSGGTEIRAGILQAANDFALGGDNARVLIADGGRLRLGSSRGPVALRPLKLSLVLSDFYRKYAAVFGDGAPAKGTQITLCADAAFGATPRRPGTRLSYKVFDAACAAAGELTRENFALEEKLARTARLCDYSDGVVTLVFDPESAERDAAF